LTPHATVAGLLSLAGFLLVLLAPTTPSSQPPPSGGAPSISIPETGVAPMHVIVPFNFDFTLSEVDAARRPEIVNRSMRARRDVAWQILRRVWAPVDVAGGRIPLWMTWYEQEDIARIYDEMLGRRRATGTGSVSGEVQTLLRRSVKDLRLSLSAERMGRTLRQFTFPQLPGLGPHRAPSTGTIYYSPAYVQHLLDNAERIARCDVDAYARLVARPSPAHLTGPSPLITIESVPSGLRPADAKNLYALCMDHEMPSDAVMVKTAWFPVARHKLPDGRSFPAVAGQHYFQLDRGMAAQLDAPPAGRWIERAWTGDSRTHGGQGWNGPFLVQDETGREWALLGMHLAVKTLRSWMWISLFWETDWGWRGDRPPWPEHFGSDIFRGLFYLYGMCIVSDFTEEDPAPWVHYDRTGHRLLQEQANTFRAVAGVMRGVQWCSNPYIETTMARGNCLGCHQGSPDAFLPTTLVKQRGFNVGDFSFSFETNRARILEIRRRHGLVDR
jgi:hypothetical protein